MEALYGFFTEYFIYAWFVVVIGVVVFVHEYGHYIVGRWCGIDADVFSIGFGRELFGWVDRRGTRWRVGLLPLGGYVKFAGDADGSSRADDAALASMSAEARARSFHGAAVWKRALAIAAGPVFNFVFSIIVFAGLGLWFGQAQNTPVVGKVLEMPGLETGLVEGDRLVSVNGETVEGMGDLYAIANRMAAPGPVAVVLERDGARIETEIPYPLPPIVGNVQPFSAAWRAGLEEGDRILSLNGTPVPSFNALRETVLASEGQDLKAEIQRGAETYQTVLVPKVMDIPDGDGGFEKRVLIGVGIQYVAGAVVEKPGILGAVVIGVDRTWEVIYNSVSGIYHLVTLQISPSNMMGPLGMAQLTGEMVKLGLDRLITYIAVISAAIGFFNLLPIPVLDGGHLLFLAIEKLKGSRPEGRWVDIATMIGLGMILSVFVVASRYDIARWLGLDG
jgi:regulator of sigma E protease